MSSILSRLVSVRGVREGRSSLDWFSFGGVGYPFGFGGSRQPWLTQTGEAVSEPDHNLVGYTQQVYKQSGPVAALVFVRQMVFSTVEFKWQNLDTRELFGSSGLRPLEEPWPGGTTQNLLAKTLVDADLSGNSYWRRVDGGGLSRLRPDWVDVVLDRRVDGSWEKVGFLYHEGGRSAGERPQAFSVDEVVHFMPLQDPEAEWRGMSWVTPVLREVMVDRAAGMHQQKFFENAATPNLAVKLDPSMTPEQFKDFRETFERGHRGVDRSYETLYLGGGADVTVVGTDLSGLDLKSVQGGLETRLAAAAGVPPVVVGFREGMSGSSLNAGNYGQARRRFADGTLYPLWMEAAGSFARVVRTPPGSRLWFDSRHVPFLREDAKDEAEIFATQAAAVRHLLDAGFFPDAAIDAANASDLRRLAGQHSGKLSVQLQSMDGDDGVSSDPEAGRSRRVERDENGLIVRIVEEP